MSKYFLLVVVLLVVVCLVIAVARQPLSNLAARIVSSRQTAFTTNELPLGFGPITVACSTGGGLPLGDLYQMIFCDGTHWIATNGLRTNGTNVGVNIAPDSLYKLRVEAGPSQAAAVYANNQSGFGVLGATQSGTAVYAKPLLAGSYGIFSENPAALNAFQGKLGIGVDLPTQELEVNGGVRLNTATSQPPCTGSVRGTFWFAQGGAGVKDTVAICAKDAAGTFAWRVLY